MRQYSFFPWSFFLLLLCLSSQAFGGDEREQLHDQLAEIAQEVTDAHQNFTHALNKAKIPLPPTITPVFASFQADAKKWQQSVDDITKDLATESISQFCNHWEQFNQRLTTATDLAESIASLTDRCPRVATTPELQRYRAFIQKRIERLPDDSINPPIETETNDQEQGVLTHHHQLLLKALEGSLSADERWMLLPMNAPALTEYLEFCRSVMASMEHAIIQGPLSNEGEMHRDETILSLLEELVDAAQLRRELLSQSTLPNTSPAVVAFTKCQERETAALHARITHQRTVIIMDELIDDEDEKLDRAHLHSKKISEIATEWLKLTTDLTDKVHSPDALPVGLPADLRAEFSKQWNAIDAARTMNENFLAQALAEGNRISALRAKGELDIAMRQYALIEESLDEQRERAVQITALRAKVADPKVAALLLKIDAMNTAFNLAQRRKNVFELASLRSKLASEIATAEAEEAQQAEESATNAAVKLSEELGNLIEEATELVGKTLQDPPPDQSPPF